MDRPPSKLWPIAKGFLAVVSALIAVVLIVTCLGFVSGFVSPDSGDFPGSVGHLFVAALYLILAGPFAVLAFVLGMPLISDNPKYRGADR